MARDITKCCVDGSATLVAAMRAIDAGGVGIALVVDAQRRLVGTITDGDIRRAQLKGASLDSPLASHVHRNATVVSPGVGRAEVLDLMQARFLEQIPVTEADGKLVGLHVLHEIIGAVDRPNWAVIMAGGRGTRLHPITENIPKPMVKVAGRPILERLVLHLVGYGIQRIFLSINHLGHVIEEHFGDGAKFGCKIEYLRDEKDGMGTGGSLSLLPKGATHPVIVLNGDLVTQANIDRMLDFHSIGKYAATMGTRRYLHQVSFGCVDVAGGRITRFEEKPVLERFVNAGVYVIEPAVIARVPKASYPITSLFQACLDGNEPVGAFEIEEDWIDVGQRDQLRRAQEGNS